MKKILLAAWLAITGLAGGAQNIIQVEYFLDTDAGVGKNTIINVPPLADGNFPVNVNLAGVSVGKHTLTLRAKDENGIWGLAARKVIEVLPNDAALLNINAEYFFDTDPGFGSGYALTYPQPDSANTIGFTPNLTGLAPGRHAMYIRSRDSYGRWSITARTVIEVLSNDQPNKVTSGEYFFDTDPGFGSASSLNVSPQDSVISQIFPIPVTGVSPGAHILYSRFRDNLGTWGQTSRRTIDVTTAPDVNNVVTVEYAFHSEPGVGKANQVTIPNPLTDGAFSFQVPVQQLRAGPDTLLVRVKDQSGISWSITSINILPIILPLNILDFSAKRNDQNVALNWRTENEVNTAFFYIERSVDGRVFSTIGKLAARPMTVASQYTYNDDIRGVSGNRLFYRLREVDNDGRTTYSKVAVIDRPVDAALMISPNPAANYVNVFPGTMAAGSVGIITISDQAGRALIKQQYNQAVTQRISVSALAPGVYMVTVVANGVAHSQQLMIGR